MTTFKNVGAYDANGTPVHDFERALKAGLLKCSRPAALCVNPLPTLDPFSQFVLRFFLSDGVQSQWPHGLGIPNGLPRPAVVIEAQSRGIEWSEHFAEKFALCERTYLDAMREINDE